jgi:hypothetical protein
MSFSAALAEYSFRPNIRTKQFMLVGAEDVEDGCNFNVLFH